MFSWWSEISKQVSITSSCPSLWGMFFKICHRGQGLETVASLKTVVGVSKGICPIVSVNLAATLIFGMFPDFFLTLTSFC